MNTKAYLAVCGSLVGCMVYISKPIEMLKWFCDELKAAPQRCVSGWRRSEVAGKYAWRYIVPRLRLHRNQHGKIIRMEGWKR